MANREYGQRDRMEDDTMVAILEAQERAIWPTERALLERWFGIPGMRIADLGCGTGLVTANLAAMGAREVVGLDLFPGHVERARSRFGPAIHPNLSFEVGDATATRFEDGSFDLVVNRCVLQAVPDPVAILAEMARLAGPEGRLYVLAEDYGLILASEASIEPQAFYLGTAAVAAERAGSDLRIGRKLPAILEGMGCRDVRVEFLPIDTVRVPRAILAEVFRAWGSGYVDFIASGSGRSPDEVRAAFEAQVESCLDPSRYFAWLLVAVTANGPAPSRSVTSSRSS